MCVCVYGGKDDDAFPVCLVPLEVGDDLSSFRKGNRQMRFNFTSFGARGGSRLEHGHSERAGRK